MSSGFKLFIASISLLLVGSFSVAEGQQKGLLAPEQIPGTAVYIPYPVKISLDGKIDDWNGIPVQRVSTGPTKGPDKTQNQYVDFAVAADDANLYVYMHSEDSRIIAGKHGANFWNEDSMEFYLNLTDNLGAAAYGSGSMQITINATNIGNADAAHISLSGVNSNTVKVRARAFSTPDGWSFEAAVPIAKFCTPTHGKSIGFQVHANGASAKDRDSKLIWSKRDVSDQSYKNPSLFGRGIFFKVGSADIPQPDVASGQNGPGPEKEESSMIVQSFKDAGVKGKAGKTIVWADEFSYDGAPSPDRWTYDADDSGKYNNELQLYTRTRVNSFVKDGKLTVSALKDGAGKWTSARLITRGIADWTYGYIEVRAKLPAGTGTWPAIWMMPSRDVYGGWPNSGEIDIMEYVGFDPDKIYASAHTEKYNVMSGSQRTLGSPVSGVCEDFHVYAIEWSPKGIFWYVDDKPFYSFLNENTGSDRWPFDQPFYLILNVAIGGSWGGMNGVDPALNRADMIVDYVRVYQ
jgi:beta-glucanase (GH16 family)